MTLQTDVFKTYADSANQTIGIDPSLNKNLDSLEKIKTCCNVIKSYEEMNKCLI